MDHTVILCNFCGSKILIEQTHQAGDFCRLIVCGGSITKDFKVICETCGNQVIRDRDSKFGVWNPDGIRKIKV